MTPHDAPGSQIDRESPLRKVRSGDYRVNFPDADDSTAYYTDNLEDSINAAVEMARKRSLSAETAKSACRTGARRTEP